MTDAEALYQKLAPHVTSFSYLPYSDKLEAAKFDKLCIEVIHKKAMLIKDIDEVSGNLAINHLCSVQAHRKISAEKHEGWEKYPGLKQEGAGMMTKRLRTMRMHVAEAHRKSKQGCGALPKWYT